MFNQIQDFLSAHFGLKTGEPYACPVSTVYVTEQFRRPKAQTQEDINAALRGAKQDLSEYDIVQHTQPRHIKSVILALHLLPDGLRIRITGKHATDETKETIRTAKIKLEKISLKDSDKLQDTVNHVIKTLRNLGFTFYDPDGAHQAVRTMINTWNTEALALVNPGPTKFRQDIPPVCPT